MIYLDNAATSFPKPQIVRDAVNFCFQKWGGNPGRSGHSLSIQTATAVYEARDKIAQFLGAENAEQIIFTPSATYAINIAIKSSVQVGEHILISDLEHNAIWRTLWRLAEDGIITFSTFSHKGNILDNILAELTPNTHHIITTHISNTNGFEFPIQEIGELCKERGIFFIVDASQSIGHLPISLKNFYCDALCASGHKGIMGIQGAGILYLRTGDGLCEFIQGGNGTDSHLANMPSYLPDKFEAGTLPTPAIVSMGAGVSWLESYKTARVMEQITNYNNQLYEALKNISGIQLFSERNSCILSFAHESIPSEEFANQMDVKGICVRGGLHCAPLAHRALGTFPDGLVRVSPSVFSSPKAIPFVIDTIYKTAKGRS